MDVAQRKAIALWPKQQIGTLKLKWLAALSINTLVVAVTVTTTSVTFGLEKIIAVIIRVSHEANSRHGRCAYIVRAMLCGGVDSEEGVGV